MAATNVKENESLVNITGHNVHGLKGNVDHTASLIKTNNILFICEHWLSNAEKVIIDNISNTTHKSFFTQAEKGPTGRPSGGNCLLVRKDMCDSANVIHEDPNILAVKISSSVTNLIVIGVYLTCYHDKSSLEKYRDQLNMLSSIIEMNIDESEIMIIGDFQSFPSFLYDNSNRNNPKRNPLSPLLQMFLEENSLQLIDVLNGEGPIYTYQHKTMKNQSYIDHVAILKESSLQVPSCVIHKLEAENLSDHQPVTTTIKIHKSSPTLSSITQKILACKHVPKRAWKDPSFTDLYQAEFRRSMDALDNPTFEELQMLMTECALVAFKKNRPGEKMFLPKRWWSPELSRSKQILSTHFNSWREDGFPRDPEYVSFNRYQLARKNFRKAVKSAQNKIVFTKYMNINSLKNSNSQKFWRDMRNLKDSSQKRKFIINNKQADEDITREFADHFNTLLNTPRVEVTQAVRPLPDLSDQVFHVDTNHVRTALKKLKLNKAQDHAGIRAEHLIYAKSDALVLQLSQLYNVMFGTGSTPECLSRAILIPLVKSYKKSLKSANNYRGISLIPILTKVLEYVVMEICPEIATSPAAQFAFKTNSSTQHAEFIINKTINHYNKNGSNVYLCSLDAEKAFDSCH